MLTVVVADREARTSFVEPEALALLEAAGTVRFLDPTATAAELRLAEFETAVADASALVFAPWGVFGIETISPACWALTPTLRVVSGTFAHRFEEWLGVELAELERRGVTVIDTARSLSPLVAEFALAMILNLLRDIPDRVAAMRHGAWWDGWEDERGFTAGGLAGRRVGLAGFGTIGRRLAELLAPFGCAVSAYDPFVSAAALAEVGVQPAASLTELAAGSEIFVVGIPVTPTTRGVVDRAAIEALPRGSLFVLASRMAVVEQDALWRRTRAGELRAAVDVFEPEPPPADSPFRTDPNVLPTPHIGGNTAHANRQCFTLACLEAVRVVHGEPPEYAMTAVDAAIYGGGTVPVVG
jgi:phosphoglycerate dehydrogenase-like enzyme